MINEICAEILRISERSCGHRSYTVTVCRFFNFVCRMQGHQLFIYFLRMRSIIDITKIEWDFRVE